MAGRELVKLGPIINTVKRPMEGMRAVYGGVEVRQETVQEGPGRSQGLSLKRMEARSGGPQASELADSGSSKESSNQKRVPRPTVLST